MKAVMIPAVPMPATATATHGCPIAAQKVTTPRIPAKDAAPSHSPILPCRMSASAIRVPTRMACSRCSRAPSAICFAKPGTTSSYLSNRSGGGSGPLWECESVTVIGLPAVLGARRCGPPIVEPAAAPCPTPTDDEPGDGSRASGRSLPDPLFFFNALAIRFDGRPEVLANALEVAGETCRPVPGLVPAPRAGTKEIYGERGNDPYAIQRTPKEPTRTERPGNLFRAGLRGRMRFPQRAGPLRRRTLHRPTDRGSRECQPAPRGSRRGAEARFSREASPVDPTGRTGPREFRHGLLERLMKTCFREDPIYADRFSDVRLWSEWSRRTPGFDGADLGIDLVAEERAGRYCAIQCKCYAPKTRISKPHLDSFIAASARDPFTARIVVDTGDAWGPNALKTVKGLTPPCAVLRFGGLFDSPFDWPDLAEQEPEELAFRQPRFDLRPHQQRGVPRCHRRLRDQRPRQAHHGPRHRQGLRGTPRGRTPRRSRGTRPLPRALDQPPRPGDARVGVPEGRPASLRRHLLRHLGRQENRGRLLRGVRRLDAHHPQPAPRLDRPAQ